MNPVHDCRVPMSRVLPDGVSKVTWRWRCPECGQGWLVTSRRDHNGEASKIGLLLPNIRMWRWKRRTSRALRE